MTFFVMQKTRFPVYKLVLEGDGKYYQFEQSESEWLRTFPQSFFSVDLKKLRRTLLQDVWLKDVSLRKVWPDTLYVRYIERAPIARWGNKAFVTQNGEIFRPNYLSQSSGLPILFGDEQNAKQMVFIYSKLNKILKRHLYSVQSITLLSRGSWEIALNNGLRLMLGRNNIFQRLERFVVAYPQVAQLGTFPPQYVDLRYPHGMAIGLESKHMNRQALKN